METIATNTEDAVENIVNTNDSVERTEETKVVTAEVANVLVEEPYDEMCPDNIYRGHGNDKPTPSSIRGLRLLGGKDYYTLSYEDPSDDIE